MRSASAQSARCGAGAQRLPRGLRCRFRFVAITLAWILSTVGATAAPPQDSGPALQKIRQTHWAFQPIRRPALPEPVGPNVSSHPIDRFIDAKLKPQGLTRSPRADRRTLFRRAYLDLIGLPPTVEQLAALREDRSPQAWARLVDRLLADPRYGRRWGRHWLDVARYSDTKGYVDAGERRYPFAWTYRDYVIRAINEDVPFDRFVLEQIAADRLADRRQGSLAAMGFLTVGSRYNFLPHDIADDRIDVITRGLMGLTVGCARCHDHKFDPISSRDYYGLYSILASSREALPHEMPRLAEPVGDEDGLSELAKKLAAKAKALVDRRAELHHQIMHEMRAWSRDYLVYIVQRMPEHRTEAQPGLRTSRGLIREVTAYGRGGVGRWRRFIRGRGTDGPVFGLWNRLVALPREAFTDKAASVVAEFATMAGANRLVVEAFRSSPPPHMVAVAEVYGTLLEDTEQAWQALKKEDGNAEGFHDPAREQLRSALYGTGAPAAISLDESEDLYHLDDHTDVRKRYAEVERVYLAAEGVERRAMILVNRVEPIDVRIFERGDPESPGAPAPRAFLKLFESFAGADQFVKGSGRLSLARAIVHRHNPLTVRVLVNRVWRWHFGTGLVETPSDFGTRTRPPSHPQLLDWLAADFIEHGWSLKHLHRRILSSQTYQQSSRDRADARAVDAENRLLWRFNRRRLEFEVIRDAMLHVAGRLANPAGGPPVNKGFAEPSNTTPSVYCLLDRELLPGLLRSFDFPSPDISSPMRSHTTGPQQSLFLLNSPFIIAQAEAIAATVEAAVGAENATGRIAATYETVLGREPSEFDLTAAQRFIDRQDRSVVAAQPVADESKMSKPLSPWAKLAHALLQTNEFLFLD